jgi:RNA polymerase sigma-70 factor (ECF subfamily)
VTSLSDEALLAGLASGDDTAAAAFVRRFQHRVFGLAASVVQDRALAEDIAQEAFVRAWRHASVFDARRGQVAGWLLTITRNLAIDALRARGARPVVVDAALEHLPWAGDDPAARATMAAELSAVQRELAALPDGQRRAVLLAAYAGFTALEISEREGLPVGTVKTRIRAGLGRLRAALPAAGEEVLP